MKCAAPSCASRPVGPGSVTTRRPWHPVVASNLRRAVDACRRRRTGTRCGRPSMLRGPDRPATRCVPGATSAYAAWGATTAAARRSRASRAGARTAGSLRDPAAVRDVRAGETQPKCRYGDNLEVAVGARHGRAAPRRAPRGVHARSRASPPRFAPYPRARSPRECFAASTPGKCRAAGEWRAVHAAACRASGCRYGVNTTNCPANASDGTTVTLSCIDDLDRPTGFAIVRLAARSR